MDVNELAERLAEHVAPHLTERAIRARLKELYPSRKRFTDEHYQEAADRLAEATRLDPSILEKTERPNRARRDLDDLYAKIVDARRATTDLQTAIRENTNARDRAISTAYDAGASGFQTLVNVIIPLAKPGIVIGSIFALSGFKNFLLVTAAGWILSGALTWLIGGTGKVHLGASGIVFAYIVYVVVRGAFTRRPLHILVGLAAAVYYGLVIVGGIVPFGNEGISWQGHLGGAIGGVFAASRLGRGKAASAR